MQQELQDSTASVSAPVIPHPVVADWLSFRSGETTGQIHLDTEDQSHSRAAHMGLRDAKEPLQSLADLMAVTALAVVVAAACQRLALRDLVDGAGIGAIIGLLYVGIGRWTAGRHTILVTTEFDRLRLHVQTWSLAFAAFLFVLFALKAGSAVSRGEVLSLYLVGLPVIGMWRVLLPPAVARFSGFGPRDCIVVGDSGDPVVERFVEAWMRAGFKAPLVIRAAISSAGTPGRLELNDLISRTIDRAHDLDQGEVYICAGALSSGRIKALERGLSVLPRAIYIVPDAMTASLVRCRPDCVAGQVIVEVRRAPMGILQRAAKRVLDVVLAAGALVFLSPLLAAVAIAIKLDSKGPVLFRQARNGYRGRPFRIFKFRTMHVQEDGSVIHQACRNDARVTRLGHFLRASSIDELPQLLNVLSGEMSLVGPRPHACAHDEFFAQQIENYQVRQHVKPGITGWAQVNGLRGETATVERMYRRIEFDLWYAANASIALDFEIMARTVFEIFRGRNAY